MKKTYYILALVLFSNCSSTNKLIPFETTKGWGYKKNKKVIIPPKYGIAGNFTTCGIAPVGDKSGNYYIDKTGKRLNIPTFKTGNFLDKFKEDVARFKKNDKIGFINKCGKIVIENKFDYAEPFYNQLSVVFKLFRNDNIIEKKYGVIDKTGFLVIPYKFDFIDNFTNYNNTSARYHNQNVVINRKGTLIK